MSYLTKLDVINDMLGLLGEDPLNLIDTSHPLVPAGLRHIDTANAQVQAKGWWFNREYPQLLPDAFTQRIVIAADVLSVDPVDPMIPFVRRGQFLFNPMAPPSEDPREFKQPVDVVLVRKLPFEDLPAAAQTLVSILAQIRFTGQYDGDTAKTADLRSEYRVATLELNSEHTRCMGNNLIHNQSVQAKLHAIGYPTRHAIPRLPTR